MKSRKPKFHASCPKRLRTALHRAKSKNGKPYSFSALARELKVNKGIIHKLVTKGIQPKDETLRLAVFLPRHPRKPKPSIENRQVKIPLSPHLLWWRKQNKSSRESIIRSAWLSAANTPP